MKTESSYFWDKVKIRLNHLPPDDKILVLDCFAGEGKIWKQIIKLSKKDIEVVSIDKSRSQNPLQLQGNNTKFLQNININQFKIIDLDAYGVPFKQLESIFDCWDKKSRIGIFVTFVQFIYGGLPYAMLEKLGYSKKMIRKCPSLFFRNGWSKFCQYLALRGVGNIKFRSKQHKHYIYFELC